MKYRFGDPVKLDASKFEAIPALAGFLSTFNEYISYGRVLMPDLEKCEEGKVFYFVAWKLKKAPRSLRRAFHLHFDGKAWGEHVLAPWNGAR